MRLQNLSKLVLVFVLLICRLQVEGQNSIVLCLQDETKVLTSINSLRKITFSNNSLLLNKVDGSADAYEIPRIKRLLFSAISSDVLQFNAENETTIYPNPVLDQIFFKNAAADVSEITVYSITGSKMISTKIDSLSRAIDVSALPKGLYVLQIQGKAF